MSGGNITTDEITAPSGGQLPPITKKRKKRVKRPKPTETEVVIDDTPDHTANTTEKGQPSEIEQAESRVDTTLEVAHLEVAQPEVSEETIEEPIEEVVEVDNTSIVGICIHRTDHLLFSVRKLTVKVSILNGESGVLLDKQQPANKAISFYENEGQTGPMAKIMGVMTQPFRAELKKSLLPEWDELIEINELFSYIISQNPIILFEVQECLETGLKTAAWAFLKVRSDTCYTDRRIRLQLFNPSTKGLPCYNLIKTGQLTKMTSSLHVTVSKLPPLAERDVLPSATNRSMRPDQVEIGKADLSTTQNFQAMISSTSMHGGTHKPIEIDWNRPPGQTSQFPNTFFDYSTIHDFGGFCCQYSPSGKYLAWTTAGSVEHCLMVQSSLTKLDGTAIVRAPAHLGLIYDLDWSHDSSRIAICSADRTATVWTVPTHLTNDARLIQHSVLPAPCYLYTVKFNPKNIDEVLIAGQNGYIYIYATFTDEQPQLLHELYISSCIINSIAFSANSAMMFAVCDDGFLYVFQHGESFANTKIDQKITVSKDSCNSVAAHPKTAHKAVVLSQDNSARLVDLRCDVVQPLPGIEVRSQLTRCCFSPCGSLILAGGENGAVVCWSSVTGKKLGEISSRGLNNTAPCRDVSFHPYQHAFASICYQTKKGVQIWRYDSNLAKFDSGTKVRVKPPEQVVSAEVMKKPRIERKSNFNSPLPEPVFSGVLNDVRAQFDRALSKMQSLNQSSSDVIRDTKIDGPMRMDELNTSNRATVLSTSRRVDNSTESIQSTPFQPMESIKIAQPATVVSSTLTTSKPSDDSLNSSTQVSRSRERRKMSPSVSRRQKPPKSPRKPAVEVPAPVVQDPYATVRKKLDSLAGPPVTITAPPTISSTSIADNDAVQHDIPVTRESQPQPSSIKLFDNIKNIANTH